MVSQSDKGAGEAKSGSGSGTLKASNTTPARSNPPAPKPRAQGRGISFVAFDAGISKENRKAVRVQAAKASAAARKATIARKQAARKKEEDAETGQAKAAAQRNPEPLEPAPAEQPSKRGSTHLEPVIRKPASLAPLPRPAEPLAVISPSTASSHSSRFFSDYETDPSKASLPNTPAIAHTSIPNHSTTCACQRCKQITPASSTVPSPRATSEADPSIREQSIREQLDIMRAIAHFASPKPDRTSVGRHDPFNCYPADWQPWYDNLLHYMMTVFAPRAWPVLQITAEQGTRWEWFMTQNAMAEPALFYVRLLFASGDLIRIGALDRGCSYWLQSQAIKAINEALQGPARSVSDGLILAVGRIALHECMYGDRAAANAVHRPAQRRMIDLRGGMRCLGFPDLVKRLMRWADRVMSMQGNTKRLLPDDEDAGNSTFGVRQAVDATEAWAPETGQALRRGARANANGTLESFSARYRANASASASVQSTSTATLPARPARMQPPLATPSALRGIHKFYADYLSPPSLSARRDSGLDTGYRLVELKGSDPGDQVRRIMPALNRPGAGRDGGWGRRRGGRVGGFEAPGLPEQQDGARE